MLRSPTLATFIWCVVMPMTPLCAQAGPGHQLDPLSGPEITRAVNALKASGRISDQARFGTITVQQLPKIARGRAARIVGFDWSRNAGFLAVIDLIGGTLANWEVVDSEPPMRLIIIRRAEEIANADPRWVAALRRRNVDPSRVAILLGMGEREKLLRKGNDRMATAGAFLRDGIPDQMFVNGLSAEINLTQGRVERFTDTQAPLRVTDSAAMKALATPRAPLAPLRVTQPAGSSITIVNDEIRWDRWSVRAGVDPRRGLEVHDVGYRDGARKRSVLFSGSVSEIVAPYGDARFGTWYPRDEGDYGMGIYSMSSAVALNDVPANAIFLPATMHDALGRPVVVPRAIAIYERDGGLLWRHSNISRRARQLVISGHSTIDNYDYQFNWIFGQDGEIDGEVILSGIMNINPTNRRADTAHVAGHSVFGHLVAPGINAPNHQHFFSWRLDLDVDGTANTLFEQNTEAPPKGTANPLGELFAMNERPLASELQAIADVSFASNRSWRVANTHQTNALGHFTGYSLVPGAVTPAFPLPGSAPLRMSGFVMHQLWTTPYAPAELYAGGEFQNLGRESEGLPTFTRGDRPLLDSDLVLWYTMGISHIPRPEDWPYMPAHRGAFRLIPTSFFSRSPVLDVPAMRD